jgi:hypothetical protein
MMACLPFFTREGTPGVFAARALDWSVDPEHNLLHLTNEEQALELGDKLRLDSPLEACPGTLVVIAGPTLVWNLTFQMRDYLEAFPPGYSDEILGGPLSPEGFHASSLDPEAYQSIGLSLASLAKTAFDQEISTHQGAVVTPAAEGALAILKGNAFTKLEELVVRRLIAARVKKDADAYRTTAELAALRLKETPKKVEELVESHFRILVEKTPFGVSVS